MGLFFNDLFHVNRHAKLNNELTVAVNWFRENGLMANPTKF